MNNKFAFIRFVPEVDVKFLFSETREKESLKSLRQKITLLLINKTKGYLYIYVCINNCEMFFNKKKTFFITSLRC